MTGVRAPFVALLGVVGRAVRAGSPKAGRKAGARDWLVPETTLGDRAEQQLREWEEYRVGRDREGVSTDPESLPPDWEVLATSRGHDRRGDLQRALVRGQPPMYARLVRPPTGGWVIVIGLDGRENKQVALACETFEDLYRTVAALLADDEMFSHHYWTASERLLDLFVAARYDRDDPAEATEQMLVGLGAKPRFLPAALTTS